MSNLELFEAAVNGVGFQEKLNIVQDVQELAMIETSRMMQDSLIEFSLIESVGRVALVRFEPYWGDDPIMPVIIESSPQIRAVGRRLASLLDESNRRNIYAEAMQLVAQYLHAAKQLDLAIDEWQFLTSQLQLCAANPRRIKF